MVITYLKNHRKKIYVICFFSVLALCAHIYNTHYYSYQLEKEIMKGDVESVREIAAKKVLLCSFISTCYSPSWIFLSFYHISLYPFL